MNVLLTTNKVNVVSLGKNRCYFEDVIDYIIKKYDASESVDILENKINILFGVHEVTKLFYPYFPDNVVIFNTEQLYYASEWVNVTYINTLKNHKVLDYCKGNQRWLKQEQNIDSELFEFSFTEPVYKNDLDGSDVVDVLFYGTYTEDRWKVFESIKQFPKINVVFEDTLWGEKKTDLINRSRIILNLHRYETKRFQVIKIFPLIANKLVISEHCSDEEDYKDLPNVIFCDTEKIAELVYLTLYPHETQVTLTNAASSPRVITESSNTLVESQRRHL